MDWIEYIVKMKSDVFAEGKIGDDEISGDLVIIDTVSVMVEENMDESYVYENFNELDASIPETEYLPSDALKEKLKKYDMDAIHEFYEEIYEDADFEIISIEEVE